MLPAAPIQVHAPILTHNAHGLTIQRSCENGNLTEIPVIQKPFELEAWNLVKPLKVKIKACGHNFWLKENDEDSCTLCPEKIRRQGACPPGKDAVFLPGRNMVSLGFHYGHCTSN
jgi:hypothetical protein